MPDETDVFTTAAELLDALDLNQWQNVLNDQGVWRGFDLRGLLGDMASGRMSLDGSRFLNTLWQGVSQSLYARRGVILEICVLIIITALLKRIAMDKDAGAAKGAQMVATALSALILVRMLVSMLELIWQGCSGVVGVIEAVFPILTIVMAASGAAATSALLQPAFVAVIQGGVIFMRNTLLPLAMAGGTLDLAGNLLEKGMLSGLGDLLKKVAVFGMGAYLTVMAGMAMMQSATASAFDAVSIKAAKYAVDSIVPYVGGMLSEMADTLAAGTLLVKNAVGMAGILSLAMVLITPLVEMLGCYLCMCLCAAVAGAFDSRLEGVARAAAKASTVFITMLLILSAAAILTMVSALNAARGIWVVR